MDAVAEVKARINIEDVIGEYVRLKRAGKNYKGLSPFSNEKTPSFVVSPEKQIWHDFSSGRGGDVFTFVQEVEGLDFKAALELLARKCGVDLEQYQTKQKGRANVNKERLHEVLDAAAKFYQVQLGANKTALHYVAKERAYGRQTILDFRLGYSPDTGQALTDYMVKKGFQLEELKATGLSVQRSGRTADMFRGRIMVPLFDQFGKVVGFTARLLYDVEGAPKYINTPSTVLYDKSRNIYGLHLAKKAIQKAKFSVLVEGNLDVIASHQAGVANVVATAGTALTEMQMKVLGRFSPDVRIAFDEDKAGLAATERAIPIASKTGVELSVITIPSGKDPDELVRQDPDLWRSVIEKHTYALDWLMSTYATKLDLKSAVGKRQFSDAILPVVRSINDQVEQDHYIQIVAKELDVASDSIRAKLSSARVDPERRLKNTKPAQPALPMNRTELIKIGDRLLCLALMLPSMRGYLEELTVDMFVSESAQKLLTFLKQDPEFDGAMASVVPELQDYVKIVSLQFEELYADVDTLELQYEAARLRSKLVELFVKDQKKQITQALHSSNELDSNELLTRVRDLDQMLKRTKE